MATASDVPFTATRSDRSARLRIGEIDRVLRPFLGARSDRQSDREFVRIWERAERTAQQRLARRLNSPAEAEDRNDALNEVMLQFSTALFRLRDSSGASPIRNLDAFISRLAQNASWKILESRHPERESLKLDIRKALEDQPEMGCWSNGNKPLVCGNLHWKLQGDHGPDESTRDRLNNIRHDPVEAVRSIAPEQPTAEMDIGRLVQCLVQYANAPIPLSDLVSAVGAIVGVAPGSPLSSEKQHEDARGLSELKDDTADTAAEVLYRDLVRLLWRSILELSPTQRCAILLNLPYFDGGLQHFVDNGIASLRDMAAALDMDPVEFAELWNELPLELKLIAFRLSKARGAQFTERKVIQFRDDARASIARRMMKSGWWQDWELRRS